MEPFIDVMKKYGVFFFFFILFFLFFEPKIWLFTKILIFSP